MKTTKIITEMEKSLAGLEEAAKTLEKESTECKDACDGLKSTIREIDGAIRG